MPMDAEYYLPVAERRNLRAINVELLRETDGAFYARPHGFGRFMTFPKSVVNVEKRVGGYMVLMVPRKAWSEIRTSGEGRRRPTR